MPQYVRECKLFPCGFWAIIYAAVLSATLHRDTTDEKKYIGKKMIKKLKSVQKYKNMFIGFKNDQIT